MDSNKDDWGAPSGASMGAVQAAKPQEPAVAPKSAPAPTKAPKDEWADFGTGGFDQVAPTSQPNAAPAKSASPNAEFDFNQGAATTKGGPGAAASSNDWGW